MTIVKTTNIWISFDAYHFGQRIFSSKLIAAIGDLIWTTIFGKNSLDKVFSHDSGSEFYDSVSSTVRTGNLVDDTRRLVCRVRQSDKTDIVKIPPFKPKPLVGNFRSFEDELSRLIDSLFRGFICLRLSKQTSHRFRICSKEFIGRSISLLHASHASSRIIKTVLRISTFRKTLSLEH